MFGQALKHDVSTVIAVFSFLPSFSGVANAKDDLPVPRAAGVDLSRYAGA